MKPEQRRIIVLVVITLTIILTIWFAQHVGTYLKPSSGFLLRR